MSSEQGQPCPQCGTRMIFRLGELECPSCGRLSATPVEAAAAKALLQSQDTNQAPARRSTSPKNHLSKEKHLYFGMQAVSVAAYIVLIFVNISLLGGIFEISPEPGVPGAIEASLVGLGVIAGAQLSLLLLWFLLYGSVIWAKWTSLGVTGICFIATLIGTVNPSFEYRALGSVSGPVTLAGVFMNYYLFKAMQLAIIAWFMSIVYRDIRSLELTIDV